jgi:hypothetical protein
MVFTSAIGVFAANDEMSNTQGTSNANESYVNVAKGTISVTTSGKIISTSKGKLSGKTVTGLKAGDKVIITTTEGKSYRWVKRGVIKTATKKKVTWKKVKGAKYYIVKLVKNGKTTYKKISGTKATAKKLGKKSLKGYKVSVRPITKVGSQAYSGEFSKTKKVKK